MKKVCSSVVVLVAVVLALSAEQSAEARKPFDTIPPSGIIIWSAEAGPVPDGWHVYSAAAGRTLIGADGKEFLGGAVGGTMEVEGHQHGMMTMAGGATAGDDFQALMDVEVFGSGENIYPPSPQNNLQPYLVVFFIQKD